MADRGDINAFDIVARDRIRRKLVRYMTEHGIGVIRMADRIMAASSQRIEIPVKTLQRFIAGKHRTNDMYVRYFAEFTENLPDADPVGELGRAMAGFLSATDSKAYEGNFVSRLSGGAEAGDVSYLSELTIAPDRDFCRVVERSTEGRLIVCDGVLVSQGRTAVIALQDRTTKAPRQYLVGAEGDRYTVKGTEAVFKPGSEYAVRALSGWIAQPGAEPGPVPGLWSPAPLAPKSETEIEVAHMRFPAPLPDLDSSDRERNASDPKPRRSLLEKLLAPFKRGPADQPKPVMPSLPAAPRHVADPLETLRRVIPDMEAGEPMRRDQLQAAFLMAAEQANEAELRRLVERGADINEPDPATGLTALHLSVGRDAIGSTRFLVEQGAKFVTDRLGRMPSTIAAECEVSDELLDFIVDAEAAAEGV